MSHRFWARDLTGFEPFDSREGHWGRGQTGFNLSLTGRIWLSDGRKIKRDGEWIFPCHRDLIDGHGKDATVYSGVYSYGFKEGPTLWLYPDAESALNIPMQAGLVSLIGVHRIAHGTPVRSNTRRHVLFRLGDFNTLPLAA